jgi:hypothetical protein
MDEVISTVLHSPAKICVLSFTVASLGYLTIKGLYGTFSSRQQLYPYPPGPSRRPLIGAMKSFPKDHFYQRFSQWAETYGALDDVRTRREQANRFPLGDIVYAPVPGMGVVILNSYEVAQELLSKRPSSTSGRHAGYLFIDL